MAVKTLYTKSETGRYSEATLGEILAAALYELDCAGLVNLSYDISVALLEMVGYAMPPQPVVDKNQLAHVEQQHGIGIAQVAEPKIVAKTEHATQELERLVHEGAERTQKEEAERARERGEVPTYERSEA